MNWCVGIDIDTGINIGQDIHIDIHNKKLDSVKILVTIIKIATVLIVILTSIVRTYFMQILILTRLLS
jgi:hypothetical protein